MEKNIALGGITAAHSDYLSADGELSTAMNLIPEDDALVPALSPSTKFKLAEHYRVMYIHNANREDKYIIYFYDPSLADTDDNNKTFYWSDGSVDADTGYASLNTLGTFDLFRERTIYQVSSIGNVLLILADDGIYYFLWSDQSYTYLGNHLPELPISFGLIHSKVTCDDVTLILTEDDFSSGNGNYITGLSEGGQTKYLNAMLGAANEAIQEEATAEGRFAYPFLVRYAYRLYDGTSLTMHSAPVMMFPGGYLNPIIHRRTTGNLITENKYYAEIHVGELTYAVTDAEAIEKIKGWSDIITSVDIFVSAPLYSYNQDGSFEDMNSTDNGLISYNTFVGRDDSLLSEYTEIGDNEYYFFWNDSEVIYPHVPLFSKDEYLKKVADTANFYLIKSIDLDKLSATRVSLDLEDYVLEALTSREVMTDDYNSHDTLLPQYAYAYNSRLNLANLRRRLFTGFNPETHFCYCQSSLVKPLFGSYSFSSSCYRVRIYVDIRENNSEYTVSSEKEFLFSTSIVYRYFFFPNPNAYQARIYLVDESDNFDDGLGRCITLPLTQHDFLNGAVYFNTSSSRPDSEEVALPTITSDITLDIQNKLYSSEIDMPFYFPTANIVTIGTGDIIAISSATKALSEGQFGAFPLYAFTTEGVWALAVSDSGGFSSVQPVLRDIAVNRHSITQLDSSVAFATDRGIMIIQGSNSQCITDGIDSNSYFEPLASARLCELAQYTLGSLTQIPFRTFISNARMLYDYIHQRLILYSDDGTYSDDYLRYAYVFSLKSSAWGMIYLPDGIASGVNSYPEALAMTHTYNLVNFSVFAHEAEAVNAVFVSRPFKLDAADTLKTVQTVITRGYFLRGDVKTLLYGSRDLFNWTLVATSADNFITNISGTPYKYLRLVGIASLTADKSISGCTVQYTPKDTARLR